MRKIQGFFAAVFFLCAAFGVFAQEAVIRELAGTVEVKLAPNADWTAASRGQTLAGDTVISTGFRSTAVIAVGESLVTVRPLTRLTLAELSRAGGNEKVALNLQTGRVRAAVKAQTGGRTDFTVRSALATASVRGTDFEFDTMNISVNEGTVAFSGASGVPVLVDSGGSSYTDESSGRAASAEESLALELRPEVPVAAAAALPGQAAAAGSTTSTAVPDTPAAGDITVTIGF